LYAPDFGAGVCGQYACDEDLNLVCLCAIFVPLRIKQHDDAAAGEA
jgi:hypothetical protein